VVWRLAGLFAVDSFGGGFVVQAFLVYWLQHRYAASTTQAGVVMFAVGVLQTGRFLTAPRIAHRIGLLPTMVATHLPSNLLLAALAIRTHPDGRGRTATRPDRAVPNGRAHEAGVRDEPRTGRPAHPGRRGHQHRPLPHPAGRHRTARPGPTARTRVPFLLAADPGG